MQSICLYFLVFIVSCIAWKNYEYNAVSFQKVSSYDDFYRQYFTFGNNLANTNIVLAVADGLCQDVLEKSAALIGVQRVAAGEVLQGVSIPSVGFPMPLNSCAEAFFYKFGSSIMTPYSRTTSFDAVSFTTWSKSVIATSVTFTNDFQYPIAVAYHGESQSSIRVQGKLEPGESFSINSFLGHAFTAYNITDRSRWRDDFASFPLVDYMLVASDSYHFNALNRLETCDNFSDNVSVYIESAVACEDLKMRFTDFTLRAWYNKRQGLNFIQPKVVRAASVAPLGFELRQLPTETYAWLKAWYDKQRLLSEIGEGSVGPCMNQQVAPSQITHLTPELKDRLAVEIKPIVQQWYRGQEDLEMTSIYGIRKYTNGSILRMHVDTVNTHVISTIINVDQDVEQDWPLVILDHDDVEHSVTMTPGSMLLYESAKLLHGRPDKFNGKNYDNIFVHYKPASGWNYEWL